MNGLGGRIAKLEERDPPEPGRNVLISVKFVDSLEVDGVRVSVPIEEPYDAKPIDWNSTPMPNGDRIHVRYPCSENPSDSTDGSD